MSLFNFSPRQLPRRILFLAGLLLLVGFAVVLVGPDVLSSNHNAPDIQAIANSDIVRKGSHLFKKSLIYDVRNRTLGFGDVFVLNLPARTDRRDAFTLMGKLTDFDIHFIEGVKGESVPDKALPGVARVDENWPKGMIGAWRAHMNAMQRVVDSNTGSALIMEDDVDWDVRLKDLLFDYAMSSNAVQEARIKVDAGHRSAASLQFSALEIPHPQRSPYGDDWDVLWLGHCGQAIDLARPHVLHADDDSVPLAKHLRSWDEGAKSPLSGFAPHTRLVGENDGTCTLAYAVSQTGARKVLYDMAVSKMWSAFDIMLAKGCVDRKFKCLGSLPQLFDHHRPPGLISAQSDISGQGDDVLEQGYTRNIRFSARLNAQKLLVGDTDFLDQWPDDK